MDTFWNESKANFQRKIRQLREKFEYYEWQGGRDWLGYGRYVFKWLSKDHTEERAHRVALFI